MADKPQSPAHNISLPQRTITVTGVLCARMCQNTVRISRLEQRSIQVAMAPAAIRDAGNRAMDRLQRALEQFEAELAQAEKDLQSNSRGNQRRNGNAVKGEPRQQLTRTGNAKGNTDTKKAAAPASKAKEDKARNQQQAKPAGTVEAPAAKAPEASAAPAPAVKAPEASAPAAESAAPKEVPVSVPVSAPAASATQDDQSQPRNNLQAL